MKKLELHDIINRANSLNPVGLYDYSNSVYLGIDKTIKIYCTKHEIYFWQSAGKHAKGYRCPECAKESQKGKMKHKDITKVFEDHVEDFHLHDYSNFQYVNLKTPSKITCLKHNITFLCSPKHHINGQRCPECAKESRRRSYNQRAVEDIEMLNKESSYTLLSNEWLEFNREDKKLSNLDCQCKSCDNIFKTSFYRFKGQKLKCPYCENGWYQSRDSWEYKLKESNPYAWENYDFSEYEFLGWDYKGKVTCNRHNKSYQVKWSSIVSGNKMWCCVYEEMPGQYTLESLPEEKYNDPCTLYHIRITNLSTDNVFDKVGITTRDIRERFSSINKDGFSYEIIRTVEDTHYNCLVVERVIKESLVKSGRAYRVHDLKNTKTAGWTECFYPHKEAV